MPTYAFSVWKGFGEQVRYWFLLRTAVFAVLQYIVTWNTHQPPKIHATEEGIVSKELLEELKISMAQLPPNPTQLQGAPNAEANRTDSTMT